MRAAGSSSAQEHRHSPMAPIQRSLHKNVGSVYDNRLVTKNDKQHDTLQFGSAVDTSTRSNMVNSPKKLIPFEPLLKVPPVVQRSAAFAAYGSKQKLPSSYSSSLSSEDRSKMPQQTGCVSDRRKNEMSGGGRKSPSSRDHETAMPYPGQKVIICSILSKDKEF